jgi:hypothetical protein
MLASFQLLWSKKRWRTGWNWFQNAAVWLEVRTVPSCTPSDALWCLGSVLTCGGSSVQPVQSFMEEEQMGDLEMEGTDLSWPDTSTMTVALGGQLWAHSSPVPAPSLFLLRNESITVTWLKRLHWIPTNSGPIRDAPFWLQCNISWKDSTIQKTLKNWEPDQCISTRSWPSNRSHSVLSCILLGNTSFWYKQTPKIN